ncbi:hypothetical protein LTR08_009187 [Meristemomyces frigidus]|nr:hypothetical protein LTR08_009187 [Meristemomyces frigidus]
MEGVQHILLDIEGTICPISFVKETLFPYAIEALPHVLATKWDNPTFQPYRDAFPEDVRASPEKLRAHVEDLTKRDIKVAYLKNLQGYLWEDGYRSSAYSTPLFPDVALQLRKWKANGVEIAIYSSGSVFAQKLLFQHVQVVGQHASPGATGPGAQVEDMTGLVSGWFDTTNAGLKTEAASYSTIVEALKWPLATTLFLSDSVREIDAATEAGLNAILVDRPGNAPVSEADNHRLGLVHSLNELYITGASH